MSTLPTAVPRVRRVGALTGDGRGTVIEQPMPELTPGMVLVRTTRSMVSAGTHLAGLHRLRDEPRAGEPRPFGYQCAGEVVAVGANVERFEPGDRVAGFGNTATHADWNVIPQNLCAWLPNDVTDEQASGMNLVLTAMNANRRAEPVFGEYFVVAGMGVLGQLCAQIAQQAGCYVMGWDARPGRLELARQWGIDAVQHVPADDMHATCSAFTDGVGFDGAIMAFGGDGTRALEQVASVMKTTRDHHRHGRIVFVGQVDAAMKWGAALGNLDLRNAARTGPGYHDKPWELGEYDYPPVLARWNTQTNMTLAVRWMAEGKLKVDPLITHRVPLDKFERAVDALVERPDETLGVVVESEDA